MRKLLSLLFFLSACLTVFSQNIQVTGTIVGGSAHDPLPGVNVVVKGIATNGTITDLNGHFILSVPSDAVLIVSYVGYKSQNIDLKGRHTLHIVLTEDTETLGEVVVVGYGVQKKSVVTAAIGSVSGDALEKIAPTRIDNVLKGQTAGLVITQASGQPGAGSSVRIRGIGTINNSDPLYLVDGMVINGGIDYLNPQDIARVEVLKDAASCAIYGARAANGVILVTTKGGDFNKKTTLSYDVSYGWQNPWKKRAVLNAREYQALMNEQAVNSGKMAPYDFSTTTDTDWQNQLFYKDAPVQNHQVSLSGGSNNVSYYLSLGYYSQDGIVGGNFNRSNYDRWSIRNNNVYKLFDKSKERNFLGHATLGTNLSYTRIVSHDISTNTEFGSALGSALLLSPTLSVYASDEDLATSAYTSVNTYTDPSDATATITKDRWVRSKDGRVYTIPGDNYNEIVNPLALLSLPGTKNTSDKFVVNAWLELGIWDHLKFKTTLGTDLAFWGTNGHGYEYYLGKSNHSERSWASATKYRGATWQIDNVLSYDKTFGKHSITAMLGQSATKNWQEDVGGQNYYLQSDDADKAWIDYCTGTTDVQSAWGSKSADHTLASYFGRLDYSYGDRYMAEFTIRRDGSSNFGPDNRYAVFPSLSAGWNVTNENFMAGTKNWLSYLKLRASWGKNGNESIDSFKYTTTMSSGNNYPFGMDNTVNIGVKPNGLSNADIKWEESEQYDFAFDSRFFNSAFTFSFDYFIKNTNGMLMTIPLPQYVGDSCPVGNVGKMRNSGVEMELGYKFNIVDAKFSIDANATYIKNKLIDLGNANGWANYDNVQTIGTITRAANGEPFPYFYGKKTNGIFQNQAEVASYVNDSGEEIQPGAVPGDVRFVDVNGDGTIDDSDRTKIGNGNPSWIFGMTINVEWKGFDLNAVLYSTVGNDIYDATRRTDLSYVNLPVYMLNRWCGEGTSNSIPRLTETDTNGNWLSSDLFVQNGSFVRLKNIQLGYTIPEKITRQAFVQRLRFYVSAENLLTITGYRGFDPEISSGGTSLGVDRGVYPQARTISVGANITF
ncbi:MAG: TonB-dependent receptor [Bacteroidaceae bacterium]|nr:TonB-dependent receptor [Bacteroidaceae bacterium]